MIYHSFSYTKLLGHMSLRENAIVSSNPPNLLPGKLVVSSVSVVFSVRYPAAILFAVTLVVINSVKCKPVSPAVIHVEVKIFEGANPACIYGKPPASIVFIL